MLWQNINFMIKTPTPTQHGNNIIWYLRVHVSAKFHDAPIVVLIVATSEQRVIWRPLWVELDLVSVRPLIRTHSFLMTMLIWKLYARVPLEASVEPRINLMPIPSPQTKSVSLTEIYQIDDCSRFFSKQPWGIFIKQRNGHPHHIKFLLHENQEIGLDQVTFWNCTMIGQ